MGAGSDSAPVVPAQGTEDIASELNGNGCWQIGLGMQPESSP